MWAATANEAVAAHCKRRQTNRLKFSRHHGQS